MEARALAALIGLTWLTAAPLARAEAPKAPEKPPDSWQPPAPSPKSDDWIRLTSGEWLRGEIELLRDDDLEFDSEELDSLTLDWKDVSELHSPRPHRYVFRDRSTRTGTASMRNGRLRIQVGGAGEGDAEILEFPRDELDVILPGPPSERNRWFGKASIGVSVRSGNTDQADLSSFANLRRETPHNRFRLDYNGSIGEFAGDQNVNTHRLRGAFDIFLTPRLYLTPLSLEVFHDRFQNIRLRLTPGAGLGYELWSRRDLDWEVSLGGAYQRTEFESVERGDDPVSQVGSAVFQTHFEDEYFDRLDVIAEYRLQLGIPDASETNQHGVLTFSLELTDIVDFDLSFVWDRVEDPVASSDGETPEGDDFRMSVGLGIDF